MAKGKMLRKNKWNKQRKAGSAGAWGRKTVKVGNEKKECDVMEAKGVCLINGKQIKNSEWFLKEREITDYRCSSY